MSSLVARIKALVRTIVPESVFSYYHLAWAHFGALYHNNPSHKLLVIGVTGTKGKSSTLEFLNAIFEAAGYKTALLSTIRIKIGVESKPNLFKMSMPGRMFIQQFLAHALARKCTVVFLEMTSEGVKQHRHLGIALDALVFTNLQKEHIESHGSFENYALAKLELARLLERSPKEFKTMVANADDVYGKTFLSADVDRSIPFSLTDAEPYAIESERASFTFKNTPVQLNFPGTFMIYNALAACTLAYTLGIELSVIKNALESLTVIPGRAEEIDEGQSFKVVVDYAHTPDSLSALYGAYPNRRRICVLGATGGGRDTWKRPEMGRIAGEYCDHVIFTNEDPYDENPEQIVQALRDGTEKETLMIMDRREAIRSAVTEAHEGDVVLITGKGTDPFIMGPQGSRMPWSDAEEARRALGEVGQRSAL